MGSFFFCGFFFHSRIRKRNGLPSFHFSTQKDRVSPVFFFQQLQRMPMFHCHGVSTSPPKVRTTSA